MTYFLPADVEDALLAEAEYWRKEDKIARIWARDSSVWTGDDEAKWLGWLDVVSEELSDLEKYRDLQKDIDSTGFSHFLLMGMGGSSLCPEVLATSFQKRNFHILDSTVPAQIITIEEKLDLANTLFIVASKSGTTLEPNCFKQYFFERVSGAVGRKNGGRQFAAITDPGSAMEQVAREENFRHILYGKPDVGGRFSALSVFGMIPAATMGLRVEALLQNAFAMVDACKETDPIHNPGALLGLILGICHRYARDKLTIFTSQEICDLGAWLEQLIAESTGKNGAAIIPVDREPHRPADGYGSDRLFVFLQLKEDDSICATMDVLEAAGHPTIAIRIPEIYNLGQEFFRWEFATAVAGSAMGINPFNQPDVESAKLEAKKITGKYEESGELPTESPFYEENSMALFTSPNYAAKLQYHQKSIANILKVHLHNIEAGDYFALLAYLEMNETNERILQSIRSKILEQYGVATCLGFGPRFLHSTGQAYKGGPNTGVFLQITADDEFDLPVPGQKYTFGVVKAAQARGDFQVLLDRGRRALRVHLQKDVCQGLKMLNGLI